MLHITFSKYDCIIVHKAYYLFTCTCVSINSFHSHSHSHSHITVKKGNIVYIMHDVSHVILVLDTVYDF